MLYTEENVRDNLRNRGGKRVFFLGKGDQLTSGARDFLARERIELLPGREAKQERWALLTGGFVEEKPEHMTHLNGDVLVPKDHPRILFRGKLDTLQARLLLAQQTNPAQAGKIQEILDFSRELMACDVLDRPVPEKKLWGHTEAEIRHRSHFPQEHYGVAHFMPQASDGPEILQLNLARCAAREAELLAVTAFSDREGNPTRPDILKALNRMSSMLYILMIERKAGKL